MATEHILLHGTCKWAKLRVPDDKYQKFSIDVFLDEESWGVFDASGLLLEPKEDDEGNRFVRFSRKVEKMIKGDIVKLGPPKVVDDENEPWDDGINIGNDSEVTVRVSVYDTQRGKGHTLEAVRVDNLVVYEGGHNHPF